MKSRWWVLAVVFTMLLAGHVILPYLLSHVALSTAVVAGGAVVLVAIHVGVAGGILAHVYARFRRQR